MPDGDFRVRHPGRAPDHFDTMAPGWADGALEALLDGDDVRIYDWPSGRRWFVIRANRFDPNRPLLPQLRKLLRDDFGVIAGRDGRRR